MLWYQFILKFLKRLGILILVHYFWLLILLILALIMFIQGFQLKLFSVHLQAQVRVVHCLLRQSFRWASVQGAGLRRRRVINIRLLDLLACWVQAGGSEARVPIVLLGRLGLLWLNLLFYHKIFLRGLISVLVICIWSLDEQLRWLGLKRFLRPGIRTLTHQFLYVDVFLGWKFEVNVALSDLRI